ncbi:MAG: helix-turn-helix transcriptional regulator [Lachnospiraceae bacterium]|nr:helix-turn-helix transcriptional regulator [Lachnospiraceae bacterium]
MFPTIDKKATGANIKRLVEKNNISLQALQDYLCLGCVQSIYRWFRGESLPTVDNLYAMSELFGVPIDDILCGNRTLSIEYVTIEHTTNQYIFAYYDRLIDMKVA